MRVGVFHPGTQHSWQTALAFQEAGTLAWYATSVFYDPTRWPYRLEGCVPQRVAQRLNREFRRRFTPLLDPGKVRQFGFWEWSETLLQRLGQDRLAGYCNRKGNQAFCQQTIRLIEREPVDLLWGYDTSSLEVFKWARRRGIRCVLDQTIGHPVTQNQVMLEEQKRHPEFFMEDYRPHDRAWIERQDAEMAEANVVVVGADFCARTLIENGCAREKLKVIPYGYDESLFPVQAPQRPATAFSGVDFLFAGEVGPRKGAAYLLKAFANIPKDQARLTLVGRLAIPPATFRKFADRVRHVPQVPRREIVSFFTAADCFVLPSLFEGSPIVLNEACGAGLGIVQSDRCGDDARLHDNGVVLGEISVAALTEVIERVAGDGRLRERWQAASWACRGERTWAHYRRKVAELVATI
jgi:glycosyltransferase involved in cell wall biosynthesis